MAVIVVADGQERSALATVRSLGQAGHEIHVTYHVAGSDLAGASRWVRSSRWIESPRTSRSSFAGSLAGFCRDVGAHLALPVTDASVQAVLENRELFDGIILPLPDPAAFDLLSTKDRCLSLASELGIDVPVQAVVSSPADVPYGDLDRVPFPAVVKPHKSVGREGAGSVHPGVTYLTGRHELDEVLSSLPAAAFPLLVQQRVNGAGIGMFFLLWDGQLLGRFSHRRLREKPPSGGVSVLRESIAFDERLGELSLRLLERADWEGAAMVEFKIDRDTGRPFLMEVNGRLWGSLQLAIDSGMDFPRLLVDAALGKNPEPSLDYDVGRRCRWIWGDTDHLLLRLRRSRRALNLPDDAPGRIGASLAYLASFRPGVRAEIWRWDDPRPFFRETRIWLRGLAGGTR